jgi:ABC-type branched-subunit amino acid transport system substrate-binding protein
MKMAVKEINENGGVLGKRLTLLIKDTKSSDAAAIVEAHRLVGLNKVPVIIIFQNMSIRRIARNSNGTARHPARV